MSNYSVKTRIRTAVPRSKRLREGAATEASAQGGFSPSGPSVGDGHTHTNKSDLDRLRVDGKYVKVYVDVEQEGETLKELEAASVGYADKAGLAEEAGHAAEAGHAEEADHASEADNAEKWGGKDAEEYIDQPVKSTSEVTFKKVTTSEIISPGFTSGALGSGFRLKKGVDGTTELEVDNISVRRSMHVTELIIQQLKHQGGVVIYSAASMEISGVEVVSGGYKCYFDSKDGQVPNEFAVGDQARCQRFSLGKTVYKYYWRLVTAVGEDYVILSSSDCDTNSVTPEKGDILVQLGNRSNTQRQAAKVTTAIGNDAPRDDYYKGINSYDLTGKLVTTVGARDGRVGIWTNDGSFTGSVNIHPGSSGLNNLSEWSGFVNSLESELQNLQNQIDGAIETWYYEGVPTLNNEPARNWSTSEDKNKHLGDLYYNKTDGKAYRFMLDDGQYKWILVEDTDITRALAAAAAAQDTADHKRRVFVSKPTDGDAYDIGDLWVNATFEQYSNAILRCVVSKASGVAFSINHWTKADGYTDDSSLNAFIAGQYAEDIDAVRSQIDGKAETWYQSTDPSTSWTTAALKSEHAGDIWFNTTADANGFCHTYIYRKNGSSYGWVEINGVPKEVFDMADGKASVYVSRPASYKANDLWIIETGLSSTYMPSGCTAGDIAVATASSSSYNKAHWQKKVKYTDDSTLANFINNTYAQFVEDIQTQVDGKAETWYQSTDPAASWTTAVKAKHVGDIWCNTANNNATKVYTSAFTWADMDCVPQPIKEAIERKANIYTTYPSEAPTEGDLLIPASDFTHDGVMYYSGQLYRYNGTTFEEIEYASNSDLAITVIEKEVWRKALQEINSSKASTVSVLKAEMTNVATVEGNDWVKIAEQGDANFGWYVSNYHEDGGKTVVTVTVKCYVNCSIVVHLMSRAESSYDYTVLGPLNGVINWEPDEREEVVVYDPTNAVETTKRKQGIDCQHTFSLTPGTHTFQIAYRKDYSVSTQPDNGYFKVDNVLNGGTLAEWCALCDRNGDTERKAAAISAANALFGYMNDTLHVWANVTTYMANDSFRDTMRSLFAAYYVAISKIETDVIGSDLTFLKAVFSKATTTITGGVVDTAAVVSKVAVVTDESNKVVAGLNGTQMIGLDAVHKKLMLFAGANGLSNAATAKFRVYEDGHVHASDMEMEGKVVASSGNIGGFEIASDSLISGTYGQGASMELYKHILRFRVDKLGAMNTGVGKVTLGSNVVPDLAGGSAGCFMIELDSSDSLPVGTENFGMYVKVTGKNTDNYAIYAENGIFGGLRPKTKLITGDITLEKTWYHLILFNDGYKITLPSSPEVGQTYELLVVNGSMFTLNGNGIKIWCVYDGSSGYSMSLGGTRECWRILYANNQWIAFPYHN